MFDIKALYEAQSISHAIELRLAHPDALILAGGSDLLIKIREGKLAGRELISIFGIDALRGVSLEDGDIRILPLTSFTHIANNDIIKKYIGALAEAVDMVGGPQIRNIGTIGGNVANGVTSADSASTLMAFDAVIELTGAEGKRLVPIESFYLSAGKTDIRPGELLTAIIVKKESCEGYFGNYIKYAMRGAMDIATLGCSVNVKLSPDKRTVERARIAFGVAAPVPVRAKSAEAAISGAPADGDTAEKLKKLVLADINPRTSWRAKKEFREQLAGELSARAFLEDVRRAGGKL